MERRFLLCLDVVWYDAFLLFSFFLWHFHLDACMVVEIDVLQQYMQTSILAIVSNVMLCSISCSMESLQDGHIGHGEL